MVGLLTSFTMLKDSILFFPQFGGAVSFVASSRPPATVLPEQLDPHWTPPMQMYAAQHGRTQAQVILESHL